MISLGECGGCGEWGGGGGGGGDGGGGIPRSKSLVEVFPQTRSSPLHEALIARLPLASCRRCLCMASFRIKSHSKKFSWVLGVR